MSDPLTLPEKLKVYQATGAGWTLSPAEIDALLRSMAVQDRYCGAADRLAAAAEQVMHRARWAFGIGAALALVGIVAIVGAVL